MSNFLYILLMASSLFLIRVLPLTLIRKPIQNPFIKSFLYYVPYVTLSVMIFPSIIQVTHHPLSGLLSLILGIGASYKGLGLFKVTIICCLSVFIMEIFL